MKLTNQIFLWTLVGLTIPIAIHFLSRKEGKVIRLGSLRHVVETSTQQFRGFRLNEKILLLFRCLLITIFSLLLSGLQWSNLQTTRWVLMEKGMTNPSRFTPILDSLEKQGFELRSLAASPLRPLLGEEGNKYFPLLKDSAASTSVSYWEAVEQLKKLRVDEVIVFSKNKVNSFVGLRPELPSNIRWISQPQAPAEYPLRAVQATRDTIALRMGHSSPTETSFTTTKTGKAPGEVDIAPLETVTVIAVSDEKYSYDKRIVKAALLGIDKSIPIDIKLIEAAPSRLPVVTSDWCIWLSDKAIAPNISPKIIRLKLQNSPTLFIQANESQWILTSRLTEEVALKRNLTLALASVIVPRQASLQARAEIKDRRMLPDSLAWSFSSKGNVQEAAMPMESANPYLLGLLLLLLLVERSLAYYRKQ